MLFSCLFATYLEKVIAPCPTGAFDDGHSDGATSSVQHPTRPPSRPLGSDLGSAPRTSSPSSCSIDAKSEGELGLLRPSSITRDGGSRERIDACAPSTSNVKARARGRYPKGTLTCWGDRGGARILGPRPAPSPARGRFHPPIVPPCSC